MRFFTISLTVLAFWFGHSLPASATGSDGQIGLGSVDVSQSRAALLPSASTIKDEKAKLTIDEVLTLVRKGLANTRDQDVLSPGISSAAYWFVIPLVNREGEPLERLLVFNPI